MGLVCRVVEEAEIPTVCIATGRDLIEQVLPPRSLFVNHPMGNAFGKPGDVATQMHILKQALDLAENAQTAGILQDLPLEWSAPFSFQPQSM